jgi:hypothetical protein
MFPILSTPSTHYSNQIKSVARVLLSWRKSNHKTLKRRSSANITTRKLLFKEA